MPAYSSAIIGVTPQCNNIKSRQLKDNLSNADLVLAAEERAKLDAVSAPPLPYPYRHQAKTASDRLSPADLSLLGPHVKAA